MEVLWKKHFFILLNIRHIKHDVENYLLKIKYNPVVFRKCDTAAGLKATKCDNACGVDGLAAVQCLHADDSILIIMSILCFFHLIIYKICYCSNY